MKKRRKQKLIKSRKKEKLEQEENNWKDLDQQTNKQNKTKEIQGGKKKG